MSKKTSSKAKPGYKPVKVKPEPVKSGAKAKHEPARATAVALAGLVADGRLPRITMLDRTANQDACKGARVTLRFSGTAVKA